MRVGVEYMNDVNDIYNGNDFELKTGKSILFFHRFLKHFERDKDHPWTPFQ